MHKNKIYLITGSTGFIGACLAHKLVEMGCNVHVVIRSYSNTWRINDILDHIYVHIADLSDFVEINNIVKNVQPEIIIHFAAYGAYHFQTDTSRMIQTNIYGTINLLNACSAVGFDSFINSGSSSEYGQKLKKIKETDLLQPDSHYAVTKSCSTLLCQCEARNKGLPINTVRFFSVFGYFEAKTRLFPTIIKACLTGQNPKLLSPDSVRDFIFVEDAIDLLLNLANSKESGQILNAGSGHQYTIKNIVDETIKLSNSNIQPIWGASDPRQTFEPKAWVADISKAKEILNWEPKYSLKSGLSKTIEWFKENMDYYN